MSNRAAIINGSNDNGMIFINSEEKGINITSTDKDSASLTLSVELYEKEAVFASIYLFGNRCYAKVTPEGDSFIRIDFSIRENSNTSKLIAEFCNELIDQQIRRDLEKKFGTLRDIIVQHAFEPITNINERIKDDGGL